ncbi:MAG: DUF2793 domain-containing protein [Pelagimonas sp.]|jgi:hypothetical protein|nr:DUF2793 domain-containing protein [Pelagimonas sp.]
MPDLSARLSLPYLLPAQAQKHVTHNEALARLDLLVQLTLKGVAVNTPPSSPAQGDVTAIGDTPTGDWAGQAAGTLASWDGNSWVFIPPQSGWVAMDTVTSSIRYWDGTAWAPVEADLSNLALLGINATADTTNRLSISADATLLNHAGDGHQLKLNKATAADTASLLYQTNWSGRAEMGTTGDDDFAIKVSADGSSWVTALQFAAATGIASGDAVQQSATDTTAGRLARADHVFGPGNLLGVVSQSGGTPTGAVLERGSNANGSYLRLADGTQICWKANFVTASGTAATWTYPAGFASAEVAVSATSAFSGGVRVITTEVPGTTSVAIRSWTTAGSQNVYPSAHLIAIGTWY